ncbi:hypothetical protein MXB_779 [Myxobolus squamalis]|nr:hypothetical protein MXB_779 [Myxobolus squamalis]
MSFLGKRSYSASNQYESKRGSYVQEEKETSEESIRQIGMQKEPLTSQEIQKLVEDIKQDLYTEWLLRNVLYAIPFVTHVL